MWCAFSRVSSNRFLARSQGRVKNNTSPIFFFSSSCIPDTPTKFSGPVDRDHRLRPFFTSHLFREHGEQKIGERLVYTRGYRMLRIQWWHFGEHRSSVNNTSAKFGLEITLALPFDGLGFKIAIADLFLVEFYGDEQKFALADSKFRP